MRTPRRITQRMFYSNVDRVVDIYETDENGNIVYKIIGGEKIPKKTGETKLVYAEPTEFYNSISGELTEDEMRAFGGENLGNAKMTYPRNRYHFKNGTLVWKESEIKYNADGTVIEESADYRVVGVMNAGQHFWKCILTEIVK